MEYIIETTKCRIGENEPFKLPKYESIENILDDLRTFKEIQKNLLKPYFDALSNYMGREDDFIDTSYLKS